MKLILKQTSASRLSQSSSTLASSQDLIKAARKEVGLTRATTPEHTLPFLCVDKRSNGSVHCEISTSHGGEFEAQNLLGCTAVFSTECRPTFRRCVPPPSSGRWVTLGVYYECLSPVVTGCCPIVKQEQLPWGRGNVINLLALGNITEAGAV
jgi:hypothetical protein